MIKYAVLSDDGLFVEAVGSAVVAPAGAIELPGVFDLSQALRCQVVAGELVPRPSIPPLVLTVAGVRVEGCPVGTLVVVHDLEVSEVLAEITTTAVDPVADLALPDPGAYQIEVCPPLPYIGFTINHEVA
jgi:hypothetical protein